MCVGGVGIAHGMLSFTEKWEAKYLSLPKSRKAAGLGQMLKHGLTGSAKVRKCSMFCRCLRINVVICFSIDVLLLRCDVPHICHPSYQKYTGCVWQRAVEGANPTKHLVWAQAHPAEQAHPADEADEDA
jgi:hypothetical protein